MQPSLDSSNQLFKAFADPTRLRILNLLREGELCVCRLIEVLEIPQSRISRHMAYLRQAGLVELREEGTWNFYRLAEPSSGLHSRLVDCVSDCLAEIRQLKADMRKLGRIGSRV
ncbi:MAG: winged helix-turn-helix transcriptional regulator [Candidatus Omnitrophica bacterium]|nr:winged helix-turn-helix transcriptional regulator [Candidatus Omnitrophota bacterium]